MAIRIQCPSPTCGARCSAADTVSGRTVKCPKCGKAFVAQATLDGQTNDTNKSRPTAKRDPFPALPAEFGRYRVLKLLGRGGMGAVYLARDSQLGREVALKIPFFDASQPQRLERFAREARSVAALHHPNICTVFDTGEIGGRPFITMAYLAGTPLEQQVGADVLMPQTRAAEIVRKVALALDYAHRKGTVHRDLKPANIMIGTDGEPVVMDFGLAKQVGDAAPDASRLTHEGGILGTPTYMSPEQVNGETDAIGPASDVYALGVVLFELLTGTPPYTGAMGSVMAQILMSPVPVLREFRAEADPRLDAVCQRAMAKAPADRFRSMAELAQALGQYLAAPSTPVPPLPPPAPVAVLRAPAAEIEAAPFDQLVVEPSEPMRVAKRARQAPPRDDQTRQRTKNKWPLFAGLIAVPVLAGVALWASGVFTAKPKDGVPPPVNPPAALQERDRENVKAKDGVLLLENLPNGAAVFVDGELAAIIRDAPGRTEINIKPGTRKIFVRSGVDEVLNETVVIEDGKRRSLAAKATVADRFVPLFNGKDLTGWSVDSGAKERWEVEDGSIKGTGTDFRTRGWLLSEKEYENFVLNLEYQGDMELMAGVGFRARPGEVDSGLPQHLVIKLDRSADPAIPKAGALYYWRNTFLQPSANPKLLGAGEWNKLTVWVQGDEVRVSVNGQEVQKLSLADIAKQPNFFPGVKRPTGRIGLQQHSGKVRYRNIEIKELPPANDDRGFVPLFNGKDLTGWVAEKGGNSNWKVVDGTLMCSVTGDHLYTERAAYRNFHLRVEVKAKPLAVGGIYFRASKPAQAGIDYDAQICALGYQQQTGSLYGLAQNKVYFVKPDVWFTYEIIVQGDQIRLLLNGNEVVHYDEIRPNRARTGHIVLQQLDAGASTAFRKIEIKELP